jgi:hypothetical protein
MVRDMTVFDNEVATIVVFRRTGRICADAASVRRLVIGRELRARGDRERPGQDLPPGDMIFGGASTGHPTDPPTDGSRMADHAGAQGGRALGRVLDRRELRPQNRGVGSLGPVDKPRPDADASEQDESHEAGGELVISGGDAALLLEMPNEALNP